MGIPFADQEIEVIGSVSLFPPLMGSQVREHPALRKTMNPLPQECRSEHCPEDGRRPYQVHDRDALAR
jgi:hypothetical protein